jgi:hypothetical protein
MYFYQIKCCFYTQNGCINKKILQRLTPSQIPDRFSTLLCSTAVASYFMYGVSHKGKYCTKFLNQYSFICSKFFKLYKYNINISHNKTTGLIYLLFSYQTGYIMWHSRIMLYIPFGCASGNIDPKPGMSHYIPCLIAE